jgi:zinc transporter ZupT
LKLGLLSFLVSALAILTMFSSPYGRPLALAYALTFLLGGIFLVAMDEVAGDIRRIAQAASRE